MITITTTGWRPGFNTVSFIKLLRQGSQSERTLAEAKSLVDGLLEGKPFVVNVDTREEAEMFERSAIDFGAVVSLTGKEQSSRPAWRSRLPGSDSA